MIKFIRTKGTSAQFVQDFFDKCVDDGALPKYGASFACRRHDYSNTYIHTRWKFAGVDLGGRTFFSDHLDDFIGFSEISNLLQIKKAAKKIIDSAQSDDDLYDACDEMEELLS